MIMWEMVGMWLQGIDQAIGNEKEWIFLELFIKQSLYLCEYEDYINVKYGVKYGGFEYI